MQEDIDRIKRSTLHHVDAKVSKTNSTLLALETLLGSGRWNTNNAGRDITQLQPQQREKYKNEAGRNQTVSWNRNNTLRSLAEKLKELRSCLNMQVIGEELKRARKEAEWIMRQMNKYFMGQLSAKEKTISKLEKSLEEEISKSKRLQEELTRNGSKAVPQMNRFFDTTPTKSMELHSESGKYCPSLLVKHPPEVPPELVNTEIYSRREDRYNMMGDNEFIKIKSEILQRGTHQRKNMSLIDISEQFKLRQNPILKVETERQKREDAPSLPKPFRKNSQESLSIKPELKHQAENLLQSVPKSTITRGSSRRLSVSEMEGLQGGVHTSSGKRPVNTEAFKARKALLMASGMGCVQMGKLAPASRNR